VPCSFAYFFPSSRPALVSDPHVLSFVVSFILPLMFAAVPSAPKRCCLCVHKTRKKQLFPSSLVRRLPPSSVPS